MPRPAAPGQFSRAFRAHRGSLTLVAGLALLAGSALAQVLPAASAPAAPSAVPASAAKPAAALPSAASRPMPARSASARNGRQVTSPLWRELGPADQQALAPLASAWDTLSTAQKRKWQALSRNFSKLSAPEQATLHSRMTEWVALSPQQRTQARLNFGMTKQLSSDEKKAKWEAYQALSAEEKHRLAAAAAHPPATAAAIRPVSPSKLASVPRPKSSSSAPRHALVAPGRLDRNTLLSRQVPASAPAAAASAPTAPAAAVPAAAPVASAPAKAS
jgi:hypothetical protein